jgi:hypothetical protein
MTKRIERKLASAVLIGILAFLSAVGERHLLAQANEPLLGTWVMDRAKSTFSGQAPDRRTMTFEKGADGIRHVTVTATTGGFLEDTYRLQYTFKIDGKDYAADAQMPVNTVSFKRIDANTIERSGKYRGEIVETVTYKVSPDSKTLTLTQTGNLNGAEVTSTQVFDRK